jgi:hypothetical protein
VVQVGLGQIRTAQVRPTALAAKLAHHSPLGSNARGVIRRAPTSVAPRGVAPVRVGANSPRPGRRW